MEARGVALRGGVRGQKGWGEDRAMLGWWEVVVGVRVVVGEDEEMEVVVSGWWCLRIGRDPQRMLDWRARLRAW
jgi:hypothetical protein